MIFLLLACRLKCCTSCSLSKLRGGLRGLGAVLGPASPAAWRGCGERGPACTHPSASLSDACSSGASLGGRLRVQEAGETPPGPVTSPCVIRRISAPVLTGTGPCTEGPQDRYTRLRHEEKEGWR